MEADREAAALDAGVAGDTAPLYRQIADQIAADILDGSLPEEAQVPSTNEFAAFHRINPATAARGVNELVAEGILYKKRGIGMFVASGARATLLKRRRERFTEEYVAPMLREARRLGISPHDLDHMVRTQEVLT
jgi:DNA-binding transcriptional regulator YhcF (GntR family)